MRVRFQLASVRPRFVEFLFHHAPVGVAQIEKRRPVGVDEILQVLASCNKTAAIDFQIAVVRNRFETSRLTVQTHVVRRTRGFVRPDARLRRSETNAPDFSAVPKGGNRQNRPRFGGKRDVERYVVKRLSV